MSGNHQASVLLRLIDQLPAELRKPIVLRHRQRWPLERIARELDQPVVAVADRLLTAAKILQDCLASGSETLPTSPGAAETLAAGAGARSREKKNDTLVSYLRSVDRRAALDRDRLLALAGHDADSLKAYFVIADELDRAPLASNETLHKPDMASAQTMVRPDTPPPAASPPRPATQSFGDYALLDMIAKGGMGVVYKARQRKLNRIVALKMILSGQLADAEEIERFYAEAEAAANLRHPNIVAIHEVGEHDGQHFFSMDYIEGKNLSQLAAEKPLSPRNAAGTLKTIAAAVEFAHQKGILHRDLKPANILLDQDDNPLVTDFGLAKTTEGAPGMTMMGQIIGTPSYMPPEQAAGQIDQIDRRSDVYSLGAILYELLTGRPPFRAATALETVRQVRDTEPTAARVIDPSIPRDLDTICLQCLQKEPSKRYATAQELAEELGRFLAGEPIRARPISSLSRGWRWCCRNPVLAAAISFAVVGLVAAAAASSIALVIQTRALAAVERAQRRDRESFRQAREAVDELFTEVSEHALLNQPGLQSLRRDLLERTLRYYQRFLEQRGDDPQLQDELAATLYRVGLITEAIGSPDDALTSLHRARTMQEELLAEEANHTERRHALANTVNATGMVLFRMQELDQSLESFHEARQMRERLAIEDPQTVEFRRKLANTKMNIALVQKEQHRFDEARNNMDEAQTSRLAAIHTESTNRRLQRDLGKGYYNLANLALERQNQHLTRGEPEAAANQFDATVENLGKAIQVFEQLHQEDAKDFANQIQLATCYNLLADLKSYMAEQNAADRAEALRLYDQAHPVLETLARMNPDVAQYQRTLAGLYLNLGLLHEVDGRFEEALKSYGLARDILLSLAKSYDNVAIYQRDLAMALRAIGLVHATQKDWTRSSENLNDSLSRLETLVSRHADNPEFVQLRDEAAQIISQLADLELTEM